MNVSFNGIGDKLVTFLSDGAKKGEVVRISAAGTIAPCADGDAFDGVAVLVDSGYAGVRLRGFVDVAYSGDAPAVGHNSLSADGNGGVKVAAGGGRDYLTVAVDTTENLATILM